MTFFWWRFLYGMFLIPLVAIYSYWSDGNLDEVTKPATVAFLIVWEIAVVLVARAKGIWPFSDRD